MEGTCWSVRRARPRAGPGRWPSASGGSGAPATRVTRPRCSPASSPSTGSEGRWRPSAVTQPWRCWRAPAAARTWGGCPRGCLPRCPRSPSWSPWRTPAGTLPPRLCTGRARRSGPGPAPGPTPSMPRRSRSSGPRSDAARSTRPTSSVTAVPRTGPTRSPWPWRWPPCPGRPTAGCSAARAGPSGAPRRSSWFRSTGTGSPPCRSRARCRSSPARASGCWRARRTAPSTS